jgi:uncharacterized protein YjbI with pentapeptide repeats
VPYVVKHRRPPEPWAAAKRHAKHRVLRPLYFFNWACEWVAHGLGRLSVLEVLEYVGSLSVLVAVIAWFASADDRMKQKHYQAWQVVNTAQGKGGSGGRIDALQELNEDKVPLVGVDASGAYLQDVKLPAADLRRADLHAADLRRANLSKANLDGAKLASANLRDANLASADLSDADLTDADLAGATLPAARLRGATFARADLRNCDLRDVRDWAAVKSVRLANVHGVRNAPAGFAAWAAAAGAVDAPDDAGWERRLEADGPATKPAAGASWK